MAAVRILGVDPGLRHTGWGVIEADGSRLAFVASGAIHSPTGDNLAERLRMLHEGLAAVVAAHRPDEAAVEETFVNRDSAIDPEARPCARDRFGRAGAGRARSHRICRQSGEKDGRRRRATPKRRRSP